MVSLFPASMKELYDRVCQSYHAVGGFQMKLLGLLPVATGTGVFLLLNGKAELIDSKNGGQSPSLPGRPRSHIMSAPSEPGPCSTVPPYVICGDGNQVSYVEAGE